MSDQLRGKSSVTQPVGQTFSLIQWVLSSTDVMAPEDYGDTVELYKRIRLLCNTLSFVTLAQPDWFPFMDGENLVGHALGWCNQQYDGGRLPLKFFVHA